jgi:hypothetical protein
VQSCAVFRAGIDDAVAIDSRQTGGDHGPHAIELSRIVVLEDGEAEPDVDALGVHVADELGV